MQQLVPRLKPSLRRNVPNWTPLWLKRLWSNWRHTSFPRRSVSLSLVTCHASRNAVLPGVRTTTGLWNDVIDGKILPTLPLPAVTACVLISNVDSTATKVKRLLVKLVVVAKNTTTAVGRCNGNRRPGVANRMTVLAPIIAPMIIPFFPDPTALVARCRTNR